MRKSLPRLRPNQPSANCFRTDAIDPVIPAKAGIQEFEEQPVSIPSSPCVSTATRRQPANSLHLGIGAQGQLATLDNALSAYARFGLKRVRAEEIIDRIWRVVRQWRTYFEGFGVNGGQIEKIASAFRHIDEIRGK